ncbi:lactoylglutathione lyase [Kordiimonas sediminis]|uniref:Lactoylglutathione lyase n=1 Tax=Kordiimonas sediminis TaxID=1735581 RepID=A0A919AK52_9PROT|nr:VOC family protein [Kordiimonas sediminis]GHF13290.1 lactoylglutathione lyase [Kordiimonas sediminis]
MIAYSTPGTNDLDRAIIFYDVAFSAIGKITSPEWTQYGRPGDEGKVCIVLPFNGDNATNGNGTMLAFEVGDYDRVNGFHAAALKSGGSDQGNPGIREQTHFVAYVRDPDGNKLCVFTKRK